MPYELPEPITRDEKYLAAAAGMEVETPEPITRVEKYLSAIAEGAGSDSYTKAETDALLGNKADLIDGTIPTTQIPPEVFERMKVVADDTARFALTTSDVQNGDIVYVDATQVMYYVYDDTKLNVEAGYKPFAAGTAAKAIADKNGNDITTTYQTKVIGSWAAGSATSHSTPDGTDTVLEALEKIDNNQRLDETNISSKQDVIDSTHKLDADLVDDSTATNKFATAAQLSQIATNTSNIAQKIGASDYATQNTGGTVRAWTTTDGTSTTLHIATEAPTP